MAKNYWECRLCDYEAENEEDKKQHLEKMSFDPDHEHEMVIQEDLESEETIRL